MKRNSTKRFFALAALAVIMSIGMSSCKSGEHCPAYGKYKKYKKNSYASIDQTTEQGVRS